MNALRNPPLGEAGDALLHHFDCEAVSNDERDAYIADVMPDCQAVLRTDRVTRRQLLSDASAGYSDFAYACAAAAQYHADRGDFERAGKCLKRAGRESLNDAAEVLAYEFSEYRFGRGV